MIVCSLNGKTAYPSSSDKIKVTYENQFVKDSGSYTYDISFPLDIADNRKVFGNVQRMDVKKNLADFEECRLYADNRLIISGKGTVTSITNTTVKVQIVGGKSRIKYNSKFEKHHIDESNRHRHILVPAGDSQQDRCHQNRSIQQQQNSSDRSEVIFQKFS